MKRKAFVLVECDTRGCESGGLMPLLQLTNGEWGMDDCDSTLQQVGWRIGHDGDYCPACMEKKVART